MHNRSMKQMKKNQNRHCIAIILDIICKSLLLNLIAIKVFKKKLNKEIL